MIARILLAGAEQFERHFSANRAVVSSELHFDSDAYLAEVRDRALRQYY
jgi:hypothetical protein